MAIIVVLFQSIYKNCTRLSHRHFYRFFPVLQKRTPAFLVGWHNAQSTTIIDHKVCTSHGHNLPKLHLSWITSHPFLPSPCFLDHNDQSSPYKDGRSPLVPQNWNPWKLPKYPRRIVAIVRPSNGAESTALSLLIFLTPITPQLSSASHSLSFSL